MRWVGGWEEKWGLKLTSAKVEVEVEAELGNRKKSRKAEFVCKALFVLAVIFILRSRGEKM